MQGKGLVTTVFVLLILACIYQLSFTWAAQRTEGKAAAAAELAVAALGASATADEVARVRINAEQDYLDGKMNEKVLLGYTYQDCKEREINLGLDLQGGMSVVMEVSKYDLIQKAAGSNGSDPALIAALNEARAREGRGQADFIGTFRAAFEEQNPGGQLIALFGISDNKEELESNASNGDVETFLRKKADEGFESTLTKLRERIDRFGVAQATLTPVEGQGRVVVELPGVDNPKQVKKLLQATANLEFWEAEGLSQDLFEQMQAVDADLALAQAGSGSSSAGSTEPLLDNVTSIEPTLDDDTSSIIAAVSDSLGLDAGLEDAAADANGPLLNKLASAIDPAAIFSVNELDTAAVMGYLRDANIRTHKFMMAATAEPEQPDVFQLYAMRLVGSGRALLEGDIIKRAFGDIDPTTGQPIVTMVMNNKGTRDWARVTEEMVGRFVAVTLDDKVYSAPVIREPIRNGSSRISGNFDLAEAQTLASILETGKLPVKATVVQEDTVGPSLGKEAIRRGVTALIIGMIMVLLFMVFYYSTGGIVADMALLANIFFVFGILSAWGATLTLPGLAGIVLTVGMAVDANVIIFERIREELAKGKSMLKAITDGYSNSYSAIIDANITTLIVAFILNTFGLGPVRGFAVVLIIGIFSSLFTAIFITRLILDRWSGNERQVKFFTGLTEGAFKNIQFDFVGRRKTFYGISAMVILLGIASMFTQGWNLGVDFKGGRTYTVRFDQSVNAEQVRGALVQNFDDNVLVKSFSSSNRLKITTSKDIEINTEEQDSITTLNLYNALQEFYVNADGSMDFDFWDSEYKEQRQKVNATIAKDIQKSSLRAGLIALIGIFFYLWVRFRNWSFGAGAIAAVIHDVLVVFGLFSLLWRIMPFSMEIGETFIAAVLTVIGYSINDTVVVFDRIREYLRESKSGSFTEIVNSAVRSTLSRTLITSVTTLIVLLALFIAGSDQIKGFAFAILIGVIVGTYSSIFVATPVVVDLSKGNLQDSEPEKSGKNKKSKKAVTA